MPEENPQNWRWLSFLVLIALLPVAAVGGLFVVMGRKEPPATATVAPTGPSAVPLEPPSLTEAGPAPLSEEPPPPGPETDLAVAQAIQGFEETLSSLDSQLRETAAQREDWKRELANQLGVCRVLTGQLGELARAIPQVRESHTAKVQQLVEQANAEENRVAADTLWRELGHFDAEINGMEAQTGYWAPAAAEAEAGLRQWEPLFDGWAGALSELRRERSACASALLPLKRLSAWDPRLDTVGQNLASLQSRLSELQQAMAGAKAELDTRAPTLEAAGQFVRAWEEFRERWRAYFYSR